MKKLSLVVLLLMCFFAFSYARNPLIIIKSSIKPKELMKKKACATLTIDWSEALYDNDRKVEIEFDKDSIFTKKDCYNKFVEGFNTFSKGLIIDNDGDNIAYEFVLKVSNIDAHVSVMGFGPRHVAEVWGELKVIDKASNEVVLQVKIDEADDGDDYVRRECFGKTFLDVGQRFAKIK
jgi:hypothetical protein